MECELHLHKHTATAHNAHSVKDYLAKNQVTVNEHPPYSPDLTPCEFYLFVKIKSCLKVSIHELSVNSLSNDDLQNCFAQWKIGMEWCRDADEKYIEGENKSWNVE